MNRFYEINKVFNWKGEQESNDDEKEEEEEEEEEWKL